MNILFDINHPAHVHLFRNSIKKLKTKGHNVIVVARDKEVTIQLLEQYNINYIPLSKPGKGMLMLALELISRQLKLIPIILKHKIQLCLSVTGASSIYIMRLFRIPFLIFNDSESAELQNAIAIPFATKIYTPSCYKKDLGRKHIRYPGFHELAYLHPNYFKPNHNVLKSLGLSENDRFFILRFVAWKASHDFGRFGFTLEQKINIVSLLRNYGKVFITSEKTLEKELDEYRIKLPPDKFLDILHYASLLVTDSQTVTTEAALLGTPAIRYNSFVGPNDMGNFLELENNYDLIYCFNEYDKVVNKIKSLLQNKNIKEEWRNKLNKLFSEKIDVSDFMLNEILKFDKQK